MNQKLNIQKQIFKWFEDISDDELSSFIEHFVFELPLKDPELLEAFLIDNGLEKLWENYKYDSENPARYFRRSTTFDIEFIEDIKFSLLVLFYNRKR